jgi:terminase small subunit / prophage DNA-packing protein
MKNQKSITPDNVSAGVLARWLGVTEKTVRELARCGVVERAGRGLYKLEQSVRSYCEHVRRTASQRGGEARLEAIRAARLRVAQEQADKLALANAVRRGELLDAGEVERGWSDVVRNVRDGMLAVPSRCGARLPHLNPHDIGEIDVEVRAVLTDLGGGGSAAEA